MNKDKTIIELLDYLVGKFGLHSFILNDFWEADLCAIGLSDPQKDALIYISTYGKKEGQYYVSREDLDNPTNSTEHETIELNELEIILENHLKLK